MSARHLVGRFFGSLVPFGPSAEDSAWALGNLLPPESELWRRMARQDRRHSIGVARRTEDALGDPPREVMAAALLHDVGKLESDLGTFLRVVATLSVVLAGRETAELWVGSTGVTRRIGLYVKHPEIGADLLAMAGSDPLTVAWAREHHSGPESWSIDPAYGAALAEADDD